MAWAALDRAVGRLPGLAGLAGTEAGAIRGARPCDMITAPGWRAGRA
jgi:hypothetical protein